MPINWSDRFTSIASVLEKGLDPCRWLFLDVETEEQLTEILEAAGEHDSSACVLPGKPVDLLPALESWTNNRCDEREDQLKKGIVLLDLSKMSEIVEHVREDQVISVQTGITLEKLDAYLKESDQWLPVVAESNETQLLDLIASGSGGFLDTGFGGLRRLALGMELVAPGLGRFKTGGKIVKNVTGFDLTRLFVGSSSWLAIPYKVHLRLFARPEHSACIAVPGGIRDLADFSVELLTSHAAITGLEILSAKLYDELKGSSMEAHAESQRHQDAILVATMHGHTQVVSWSHEQALATARKHKLEPLAGSEQEEGWQGLFDFLRACSMSTGGHSYASRRLRITTGVKVLVELLAGLEQCVETENATRWRLRPATGELELETEDTDMIETVLLHLRKTCDASKLELAPSYSTSGSVANFSDPAGAIKEELKNRFDPNWCLNPLVSFSNAIGRGSGGLQ